MERVKSFEESFKERFPEQDKAVRETARYMTKQLSPEERAVANAHLEGIASSVLDEEMDQFVASIPNAPLTESLKCRIEKESTALMKRRVIMSRAAIGHCLICGNQPVIGDIVLADTTGEGNLICLDCCNEHNHVSDKFKLFKCEYE